MGSISNLGYYGWREHGRATFLGSEGPGAALLALGDINFVHMGADADLV